MENLNQSPEQLKEKEYQEIQQKATAEGHLEDIDTHVSSDIEEIMNANKKGARGNNDITPGLGTGVDGTGSPSDY